MIDRLAILGAGGHSKVVMDIALANGYTDIQFFDDILSGFDSVGKYPISGTVSDFLYKSKWSGHVIVAIGDNAVRQKIQKKVEQADLTLVCLIHPASILSPSVKIGAGTVVMAGVVVNVDAFVGSGCILNTGCTIDHDCAIYDFTHISPGVHLAGNVSVGQGAWLGIGSTVIQNIRITDKVQLGANTTVIANIDEPGLYVGSPAKCIK